MFLYKSFESHSVDEVHRSTATELMPGVAHVADVTVAMRRNA
jgi:hypothetical protein